MKNSALDVRRWNLAVPLSLLAACGGTIPLLPGESDSDTDATTTQEPTEPSDPTIDPTTAPECEDSNDCPGGTYCDDHRCVGYPCNDPCCWAGTCGQQECYNDDDCGPEAYCYDFWCIDKPECNGDDDCGPEAYCSDQVCVDKPGGKCKGHPVAFIDAGAIFSHSGSVSLAFVETPQGPGRELVIADATQVVVHGDAGPTLVVEMPTLSMDVGDLDGDGDEDIVVLRANFLHSFLFDAAQGVFLAGPESPLSAIESGVVTLADFDGSATKDAFVTTPDGTVWFAGLGDGTFSPVPLVATGAICGLIAVPSLSLGGADDVMYGDSAQAYYAAANPEGVFAASGIGGEDGVGIACPLATGDFDSDGTPDAVMLSHSKIDVLSSWAGVATFPATQTWNPPAMHDLAAVADLDGDGADDVLLAGESINATLRFGTGGGEPEALGCYAAIPLGFDPQVLLVGDHDGDGRPDIVGADGDRVWVAYAAN